MEGLIALPTNGFTGFSGRVNLIALFTFTLVAPNQIDANLAAYIWVGAFIDVCVELEMGSWLPLIS